MLTWIPHSELAPRWPSAGRHVLASYDDESVIVYQAYRPSIGHFAAANGFFGGDFSTTRMSWIKPNFLWMMYRSGWGTKESQEVTLAVHIQRTAFDQILAAAVPSSFDPGRCANRETWQDEVAFSEVRLQWDPDHAPSGAALERRAVQLGLRGSYLAAYAREWIVAIEDISDEVRRQRENLEHGRPLLVPNERVYPVRP